MPAITVNPPIKAAIIGLVPVRIYGILDADTGRRAFDYDTFVSLKVSAKSKVSDFIVENGAFATYNKASSPNTAKVQIAVSDTAPRRKALQIALDATLHSVQRFNLVSQDATYLNYTLDGYSISFTKAGGWGVVVADLQFIEVREVFPAYTNAKVGAGGTKGGGLVPINFFGNDTTGEVNTTNNNVTKAHMDSVVGTKSTATTGKALVASAVPSGSAGPSAATTPAAGPRAANTTRTPGVR